MDSIILTGPQGTSIEVGSWLRVFDTPDYGAKDILVAAIADNPLSEGGVLTFEDIGPRHMALPLRVASGAWGSLTQIEALLRLCARPGAVVDIQPEGEAQAVRFDVISGRWEEAFDTYENRAARRSGTLKLDCMPFGYLPTWILLASQAALTLPGSIDLSAASIMGDVPGLARLVVQPTAGTNFSAGSWAHDGILWSLAGASQTRAWWTPTYLQAGAGMTATVAGNAFAPASQVYQALISPAAGGTWMQVAALPVGPGLAYRGRWRVFALAQLSASLGFPFLLSADAAVDQYVPMASSAPIATLPPLSIQGALTAPSAGFALLDLGVITTPSLASSSLAPTAAGGFYDVRIWGGWPTTYSPTFLGTTGNTPISIAGVYLLPLEGPNGVLPRGLFPNLIKNIDANQQWRNGLIADSYARTMISADTPMSSTAFTPRGDMLAHHRGGFPYVSPTTLRLDVFGGERLTHLTYPDALAAVTVGRTYYWRFSEGPGASQAQAWQLGRNPLNHYGGAAPGASGGVSGDSDPAIRYDGASAYSAVAPGGVAVVLQEFLVSALFNVATIGTSSQVIMSTTGSPSPFGFELYTNGHGVNAAVGDGASYIAVVQSPALINASEWHHVVVSVTGTGASMYLDGVGVAGGSYALGTPIFADNRHSPVVGAEQSGTSIIVPFPGAIDEIAVHAPLANGGRVPSYPQIRDLYHAARSAITATTSPLFYTAPPSAAVSLQYRPRFTFLKGL